eukprot:CAMPEP_0116830434 /NCGR_PEP_ID=MMETSP0418-20121206/4760_1 /TAXON_ID=1158023 /ORGANISM="Astrosyne radiata, Strain 13vi08-1A" /LENGTH=221 /DNA_ID=CAMNT_0004459535 /DNA_START=179 /DNA_END=844 /DNA_ORIENTATION=+
MRARRRMSDTVKLSTEDVRAIEKADKHRPKRRLSNPKKSVSGEDICNSGPSKSSHERQHKPTRRMSNPKKIPSEDDSCISTPKSIPEKKNKPTRRMSNPTKNPPNSDSSVVSASSKNNLEKKQKPRRRMSDSANISAEELQCIEQMDKELTLSERSQEGRPRRRRSLTSKKDEGFANMLKDLHSQKETADAMREDALRLKEQVVRGSTEEIQDSLKKFMAN